MYLETISDGGSPIFEDISTFSSFHLCSNLIIGLLKGEFSLWNRSRCHILGRDWCFVLSKQVKINVGWGCFIIAASSSFVDGTGFQASLVLKGAFPKLLILSYSFPPAVLKNLVSQMSGNSYSSFSCLWSSLREAQNRNSWGSDGYSCGTPGTITHC